jgi:hypothetical protein
VIECRTDPQRITTRATIASIQAAAARPPK